MITIKNTQRTIAVNIKLIKKDLKEILELLCYQDYDLGVWITTDKTIRAYNKQYRDKDKATDILSFPYYPALKAGERIEPSTPEEKNLGDLIISASYVACDANAIGISFEEHMRNLLVHGVCHLLGYDHIEDQDYRRMRAQELYLIKALAQKTKNKP